MISDTLLNMQMCLLYNKMSILLFIISGLKMAIHVYMKVFVFINQGPELQCLLKVKVDLN